LTRFGSELLEETDANKLLEKYIGNDFGEFKILSTERGCIPMSNCKITNEHHENVMLLGARNYRIKPSTGYAFKNMYKHAFEIAESIENNTSKSIKAEKQKTSFSKSRFAFYDALLLTILKEKPQSGKKIFSELFKKANTFKVLEFLDEKSKILDEISLFSKLPWAPFLWALHQKVINSKSFRPLILLLFTSILLLLGRESVVQSVVGYGFLLVGLIAVGIPHGAVDHLIEIGKWESRKVPIFIVKYIALAALMGICWYFLADWALLVFLLYSAWHFGQADGELWKLNSAISFLWGAFLLVFILGTHTNETNAILQSIGANAFAFSLPYWIVSPWLIWALMQKKYAFTVTILWLTLATQLPLLLAFGLYFIGQHSVTSWKHISIALNQSNRSIWLHSLPFQVGAWLILALFIFLWPTDGIYNFEMLDKFGVFFIFISCISFPHVITMNMLYGTKTKETK
jgi:Brp/Blh family beta-carotene 15,15'-monooxygenase